VEETPSAKTYVGWAVAILGGLALLAAALLALWHVFLWLRDGLWPHLSGGEVLAGLGVPQAALPWGWAQSAVDWILSWSAAFLLTCSGAFLVVLGTNLSADYDAKAAAAKKARAQFAPASDAKRAANWARGSGDTAANLESDTIGTDEEAEKKSPPPSPPRSFLQRMTDNLLGCGCIVLLFGAGFVLFIGWDYFDRTHYNRVSAHVLTVARSCVLQSTGRYADYRSGEMPCDQAPRQPPTSQTRVVETLSVTYTYTSPVDGRTYRGALHRDAVDFPPDVRAGGEMPVYSLKADPSRSRGIYGWPVD
jgi:hypothetical protein